MKQSKFAKMAFLGLALAASASAAVTVNSAEGWLESAFIVWTPVSGATSYTVYADGNKIDNQLIRSYDSYMRADVVGLKAGSHTLKVESNNGQVSDVKTVTVKAHDRAGFAFNGFIDGKKVNRIPGAYNMDGTLKSGAVVLYISENTKNTITMDVTTNSKGTKTSCKSFQGILDCMKKGYETRPIDFRFIGNVTDAETLIQGDMLIDLGSSENSYVTVEGIGTDAVANGWGIRIKNAQNVEVRNMGIMNVNSYEGDNIGLQQNNQFIWVHNNDFFYGDAGTDKDQVKGDGALDCKQSTNITFSYNHFWDNGKSNLLGLKENTTKGLYITYHHNWYDHSDSRHPRVRFYSAHVYNNYYDGNAKYGIGSTLGSSVFAEANYFRNCKYPMLTSMQGSDVYAGTTKRDPANYGTFSKEAGGSIKAYNNYIEGGTFIPYGAIKYTLKGKETDIGGINSKEDFDAYIVTSRDLEMPASVTSFDGANVHNNFDLNLPYSYNVDEPAAAKTNVMTYAGRIKGGDFKWTFSAADDEKYAVDQDLKNALVAYTGSLKSIQGDGDIKPVITSSSSVKQSSSSVAQSSSSVKQSSSSIAQSSSSVREDEDIVEDETPSTEPITATVIHNFTEYGASSNFFEFFGNTSDQKGVVTYDGLELSRCFKIETTTYINFTLAKPATMTLVFSSGFAKGIKINGVKKTASDGILTMELEAGDYTITKGDATNLYLISIEIEGTEAVDPDGNVESTEESSSSEESSASNESSSSVESSTSNVSSSSVESSASNRSSSSVESSGSEQNSSSSAPVSSSSETTAIASVVQVNLGMALRGKILELSGARFMNVDVFDMQGRPVARFANVANQVSLEGMSNGSYIVRIRAGSQNMVKRISIK